MKYTNMMRVVVGCVLIILFSSLIIGCGQNNIEQDDNLLSKPQDGSKNTLQDEQKDESTNNELANDSNGKVDEDTEETPEDEPVVFVFKNEPKTVPETNENLKIPNNLVKSENTATIHMDIEQEGLDLKSKLLISHLDAIMGDSYLKSINVKLKGDNSNIKKVLTIYSHTERLYQDTEKIKTFAWYSTEVPQKIELESIMLEFEIEKNVLDDEFKVDPEEIQIIHIDEEIELLETISTEKDKAYTYKAEATGAGDYAIASIDYSIAED